MRGEIVDDVGDVGGEGGREERLEGIKGVLGECAIRNREWYAEGRGKESVWARKLSLSTL